MLNRVVLIGRLTKDCELRYTPNGVAVATFTLAVDRAYKKDKADFIPIVVWRAQAENCANYIGKGSMVAVDGRLQVRTYEGKDGKRRWVTEVVAENVRFLDKKGERQEKGQASIEQFGQEVEYNEDEIPF